MSALGTELAAIKNKNNNKDGLTKKLDPGNAPSKKEDLDNALVTQHSPEGDREVTKIFDNFLFETYEPQQIQVNNRLVTLKVMLDVVETVHTEISKINNLEGEIKALKSDLGRVTNPVDKEDLQGKVATDNKQFTDLDSKIEQNTQKINNLNKVDDAQESLAGLETRI